MLTLRARMNAAERNLLAEPLTNRPAAEQCGVLLEDAPELVRLDEVRPAVYRVAWSLSSAASGRLRRRPPGLGQP